MIPSCQKRRNKSFLFDYNEVHIPHKQLNPSQVNSKYTNKANARTDTMEKYNERIYHLYKIRRKEGQHKSMIPLESELSDNTNHELCHSIITSPCLIYNIQIDTPFNSMISNDTKTHNSSNSRYISSEDSTDEELFPETQLNR